MRPPLLFVVQSFVPLVAAGPRNRYDQCPAGWSRRGRAAAPRQAPNRYRPAEGLAHMRGTPV